MKKHLKFSLKLIFKTLSLEVLSRDKKESKEQSEDNNTIIEKKLKYFLHFFKNRLYLTDLILIFNLNVILSFSFAAAVIYFFNTNIEIM